MSPSRLGEELIYGYESMSLQVEDIYQFFKPTRGTIIQAKILCEKLHENIIFSYYNSYGRKYYLWTQHYY